MSAKKVLGALILEFYREGWPEGYYHDGWDEGTFHSTNLDAQFEDRITPTQKYPLSAGGYLLEDDGQGSMTFAKAFAAWNSKRGKKTLLVTFPEGDLAHLREVAKAKGWKLQ